jgi:ribonuclease HI
VPLHLNQTNNVAELLAIEKAIDMVQNNKKDIIKILTDSSYSINCLTKWYNSWAKKNFYIKVEDTEAPILKIAS